MKTFIVQSYTNYGAMVYVVNAENSESAYTIAREKGAWEDSDVTLLDTTSKGHVGTFGGDGG